MRRTQGRQRVGLYRSRNGMIFGVCKGIAEYLDFSVFWTRIITFVSPFFPGIWPVVGLYLVAALLIKPEPVLPVESGKEQEFYDSYINSQSMALSRLKRTFDTRDHLIRQMENIVTTREYDWERRLNENQ